ncbi:hypothetical protein ACIRRT_10025 [Streptomyces sp. NPDC102256]|uniref:hypothetical protein n=1 Tax=Streptomyces sp. NPDC102256 TaxID=3366147 RepID=UPI00382FD999
MTIRQIEALPERPRIRAQRHTSAWWSAVMQPMANWQDSGRPAASLINQDRLDHLESTADVISSNLEGTAAAPNSDRLEDLAKQCQDWLALLSESSEIAPALRDELLSQIRHLIWLIEHADLFGGARVAQEASGVIGSLTQAVSTLDVGSPARGRWMNGLLAMLAACVFFNQAAPIVQESISAGSDLVKEISTIVEQVQRDD